MNGLPSLPPSAGGPDDYLYSLAPGSSSLGALGYSAADILTGTTSSPFLIVATSAGALGLAAGDNLDAMKCLGDFGGGSCPAKPWPTPIGDGDCDGFTTTLELFMGTDPADPCAANNGANNEPLPDAWPFDFNDNQRADLGDVLGYIPVFNSFFPTPPYNPRWDLNASGGITLGDVLSYIPVFNLTC